MEQQILDFVAQKLRTDGGAESLESVLTLMVGHKACMMHDAWIRCLQDAWSLSDSGILCHGFIDPDHLQALCGGADYLDVTPLSGTEWTMPDQLAANQAMFKLTEQFSRVTAANPVICLMISADDPLVRIASDLLSLASRWYRDCCDEETFARMRTVLVLMMPIRNRVLMGTEEKDGVLSFVEKVKEQQSAPIFMPTFGNGEGKAYPLEFERSMEVFFLDESDVPSNVLSDAACLLTPAVRKGSGMFLAAFENVPGFYRYRIVKQMIAAIEQLSEKDGQNSQPCCADIVEMLRDIVTEESEADPFRVWMHHSCVLQHVPGQGLTEKDYYQNWLKDLSDDWCTRFVNRELPEERLCEILNDCSDLNLSVYRAKLTGLAQYQRPQSSRRDMPIMMDGWRSCLDYAIDHTYIEDQREAIEMRLYKIVQRMLTMLNERMNAKGVEADDRSLDLLAQLRGKKHSVILRQNFSPVALEPNERVQFEQLLHELNVSGQRDYRSLLAMTQRLIDEKDAPISDNAVELDSLCQIRQTKAFLRPHMEYRCQIHNGIRTGQKLYTLNMSIQSNTVNPFDITFLYYCKNYR